MPFEFLCPACGQWQSGEIKCIACDSRLTRPQRRETSGTAQQGIKPAPKQGGGKPGGFTSSGVTSSKPALPQRPPPKVPTGISSAPTGAKPVSGPSPLVEGLATLLGAKPGSTPSEAPVSSKPLETTPTGPLTSPVTMTASKPPVGARKTLSVQERTKQNEASKKLLTDLGHLPGERPALPVATTAAKPKWQVTPGAGVVPKGEEAAEKKAREEFEALYNSTATVLQTLLSVSVPEYNRLNNAGVDTWNLTKTTFVEKLAKMKEAAREINTVLVTETKCKSEFNTIYAACNDKLLPELQALNVDERNRAKNIAVDVFNLDAGFQDKLRQVKIARDFLQTAIDKEKAGAIERKKACETATKEVAKWTPEHIARLGTKELTEAMAKLTCVPKSEQPKEELAKLYRAMRPDPDFVEDDRAKRDKILGKLVQLEGGTVSKFFNDTRSGWGTDNELGGSSQKAKAKREALTKFQDLQTAELGFRADPIEFTSLEKGNSGVCSGKKVKISINPADNKTFDETLNTVAHETTHAYQNTLTEQLKDGSLQPDDPRYAQATLFMLNNQAYADPPERPEPPKQLVGSDATNTNKMAKYQADLDNYKKAFEKYKLDYAAYKEQPVEWHAWKAGDEAGRAFDVSAFRVNIATRLQAIVEKLGTNAEAVKQASRLKAKLSTTKTVPESIDLMNELEKLAA